MKMFTAIMGIAAALLLPVTGADSNPSTAETSAKKGKILFVLTSHDRKGDSGEPTGFYLSEATHPYHVVTSAGYGVDFVSPKGGKAPVDGMDLKDEINRECWENPAFREGTEHTLKPGEVKPSGYVAIFYAGGHGAMWDFPSDEGLAKIAGGIYDRGGVVGAVCHGPAGLLNVTLSNGEPLVKSKDVAAFTDDEEAAVKLDKVVPFLLADELVKKGAKHHPAANFQKQVIVSERLVTGQNPASAKGVGEEMVKLLDNKAN